MDSLITETTESTVKEISKSQLIRIIDVTVIGPTLIYSGTIKSNLPKFIRFSLVFFGACTIYYNAKNYYLTYKNTKNVKV
jgi:hypothetical protein